MLCLPYEGFILMKFGCSKVRGGRRWDGVNPMIFLKNRNTFFYFMASLSVPWKGPQTQTWTMVVVVETWHWFTVGSHTDMAIQLLSTGHHCTLAIQLFPTGHCTAVLWPVKYSLLTTTVLWPINYYQMATTVLWPSDFSLLVTSLLWQHRLI